VFLLVQQESMRLPGKVVAVLQCVKFPLVD
jgi:hypothetical protein